MFHLSSEYLAYPSCQLMITFYFEFFPKHCFVKDEVTHQVLIARRLKDGLYVFDPPEFLRFFIK